MNHQEAFEMWKRRKEQVEVPPDFSDTVMVRVRERRAARAAPDAATAFLRQMVSHRWAKAAMIVLGVSLGLARILLTLQLILFA